MITFEELYTAWEKESNEGIPKLKNPCPKCASNNTGWLNWVVLDSFGFEDPVSNDPEPIEAEAFCLDCKNIWHIDDLFEELS